MNPNYDSIAKSYDRRYLENDYSGVEEVLIAFVGPDLNGRVLEVGCGTGGRGAGPSEVVDLLG